LGLWRHRNGARTADVVSRPVDKLRLRRRSIHAPARPGDVGVGARIYFRCVLRLALRPRYERAEVEHPYSFEGAHDLPPARAARSITDDVTNVRFAPIPVAHELISVFVKSYQ
jgi:hypothetical protein